MRLSPHQAIVHRAVAFDCSSLSTKRNKQKRHKAISAYLGLAVIMDTILGNSLENVPLL